jgi:hypothetical protein
VVGPPAVPKVAPSSSTQTHPQQHPETDAKHAGQGSHHASAPELPPLKPLSTTEMRVFLGGLPPDALFRAEHPARLTGHFDSYA